MTAEMLREAAAKMRERAEAASGETWRFYPGNGHGGMANVRVMSEAFGPQQGVVYRIERDADAAHVASWHPAVALAVADWLDRVADMLDRVGSPVYDGDQALAVARTYLGKD